MREIKFRACGPNSNYMWDWDGIKNCNLEMLTLIGEKILMQFTGLKDKNGVEIYEGDNLRLTNGKFWWTYVVSTIPNNRTSTLYAVEVKHNITSEDDRYTYEISDSRKGIRNELEFLDCKRLEVIGNIHENKELLR